jgi:hypothetical protein
MFTPPQYRPVKTTFLTFTNYELRFDMCLCTMAQRHSGIYSTPEKYTQSGEISLNLHYTTAFTNIYQHFKKYQYKFLKTCIKTAKYVTPKNFMTTTN